MLGKCTNLTYVVTSNISNIYFDDEDMDNLFIEWLNIKINKKDLDSIKIVSDKKFDDLPDIEKIEVKLYELSNDHDMSLIINIYTTEDRDIWDVEEFIDNTSLRSFIEEDLIPRYINEFNDKCDITFPTMDGNFNFIVFNKGDFYAYLYSDDNGFHAFSTNKTTFQLKDEFELNY